MEKKNFELDMELYAKTARAAAAEGCVLLENQDQALPLRSGDRVAVFGRTAFKYYKSGLGSGGLVNTRYVSDLMEGLLAQPEIQVDEQLMGIYKAWLEENPYDEGQGWGKVPWAQKEMPVTEEMLECARRADACLIFIGRTAGEDQDNRDEAGSYRLSETEEELIRRVCEAGRRVIVALNVGNIMDMSWVKKYQPQAVIYIWQGGQEGANGAVDVLTGKVNPSGHLTDTIAETLADYPSHRNFGDLKTNLYQEDIYVGYRYFETFAKDRVLYPFGYGLSYTTFEVGGQLISGDAKGVSVRAAIKNTGAVAGKEALQIYIQVPQGKLGNPARQLIAVDKTSELEPGQEQSFELSIPASRFASYDDSGVTGHRSCYVLEAGEYTVYVGGDVRAARPVGSFRLEETVVLEQLREAYAPVQAFDRMRPVTGENGEMTIGFEPVPLRTVAMRERLLAERPADPAYTGDKGYRLVDVWDGKVSMDAFVAQLSDKQLLSLFHAEGMCSPKVTPGTASAFGGLTPSLKEMGIPVACCADGPSGIRMDCGTIAFSLPNGTCLGCTFNEKLVESLYELTGREVRRNKIDSLLGPGLNIHRHPLNGRNFEYISEDPYLTGLMGAAQTRALARADVAGTIKHFCGNNQEAARSFSDSVISERALRQIYLKGFEMCVKEGQARSVMTTYGSVNGLWTAGSYDLCTTILRGEWGFEGIVMTDWWAVANYEGEGSAEVVKAPMIAAQNDLFMVCPDAEDLEADDALTRLKEGYITRGELARIAENILGFILKSPAMQHFTGRISPEELEAMKSQDADEVDYASLKTLSAPEGSDEIRIEASELQVKAASAQVFALKIPGDGIYEIEMTQHSDLNPLAQLTVSVALDNIHKTTVSMTGTNGKSVTYKAQIGLIRGADHYLKLFYQGGGMEIEGVVIRKLEDYCEETEQQARLEMHKE